MTALQDSEPVLDLAVEPEVSALLIQQMLCSSDTVNHQTAFPDTGDLQGLPNGVYLSPERTTGDEIPKILHMDFLPGEFELGAADSHHGVRFGFVQVERADGSVDTVHVAVKPLDSASQTAVHEQNAHLEVANRGFQTFEPLAIIKHDDTDFLVTRYREDILTRNNIAWTISPSDSDKYESEIVPTLNFMAESLADLHAAGIFHGDAQAKNFAVSDEGGQVVIDLEDAVFVETGEELIEVFNWLDAPGEDVQYGQKNDENKAFLDLTHCWYALIHPTPDNQTNLFLEGEPTEVCMREFEARFLEPYFNRLRSQLGEETYNLLDTANLRQAVYYYIERTT